MDRPLLVSSLVLAIALAGTAPALAQPAKHAQAEEQFRQGREAQNKGDFARALELLKASQAIEPGRGKLLNMALCEEELSLLTHALHHLEEVRAALPAGDDRLPIVEKRLADIRPRVPVIRIEATVHEGSQVKLDGEVVPAAALAGEIPVDPGKHTLTLTAQGQPEVRQDFELHEKEHRTVTLAAVGPRAADKTEAPPPPDGTNAAHSSTYRLSGFVVGGVGVAALVVGIGTGIGSIVDHGSATSACPSHVGCSTSVLSTVNQGKSLAAASTGALVAGAALAGVGLYLVVSSSGAAPKATTGIVILPGGARFEGRF
jgi:hypothetical protein